MYADFSGVAACGSKDSYLALLSAASGSHTHGDFFHPSIYDRLAQVRNNFPVLGLSFFWVIYWIVYAIIGYGKTYSYEEFIYIYKVSA